MTLDPALVERLRKNITDEVIWALGLPRTGWTRSLFGWLVKVPAQRFAEFGASFDAWLGHGGLAYAARQALPLFVDAYEVWGTERIPASGPLILAGNHPGAYDGFTLLASVPRDDIKVIASNMPFVKSLPNSKERTIFASADTQQRLAVVREAIRHLEGGGMLIIFPSGHIDPDPEVLPGAREALGTWSPSVDVMIRHAPETRLLVTICSGVLAPACARHPITWLRRGGHESRRLAEMLQIVQQLALHRNFHLRSKVSYGWARSSEELQVPGERRLTKGIQREAVRMLDEHLLHWGLPSLD